VDRVKESTGRGGGGGRGKQIGKISLQGHRNRPVATRKGTERKTVKSNDSGQLKFQNVKRKKRGAQKNISGKRNTGNIGRGKKGPLRSPMELRVGKSKKCQRKEGVEGGGKKP